MDFCDTDTYVSSSDDESVCEACDAMKSGPLAVFSRDGSLSVLHYTDVSNHIDPNDAFFDNRAGPDMALMLTVYPPDGIIPKGQSTLKYVSVLDNNGIILVFCIRLHTGSGVIVDISGEDLEAERATKCPAGDKGETGSGIIEMTQQSDGSVSNGIIRAGSIIMNGSTNS